jgi:glutaredoxin
VAHVVVYTKMGCHLCEDVIRKVENVRERIPFDLDKIDIRSDAELTSRFVFDIPVVEIDGKTEFTTFLNEIQFEEKLKELTLH